MILDACRYDVFEETISDYMDGRLKRALSPGSATISWLRRTWYAPFYEDIIYIAANPFIGSAILRYRFDPRERFSRVVEVWRDRWSDKYITVPPWAVNGYVKRVLFSLRARNVLGLRGKPKRHRLVIHYMQPHFPYMASEAIIRALKGAYRKCPELPGSWLPIIAMFSPPQARKGLSPLTRYVRRCYTDTLRLVLRYVAELTTELNVRNILITADHGELLGEYGLFLHP